MEDYRTIAGRSTAEVEEKHSRFIALAAFADSEEKALAVLDEVRAAHRTARHNVYAYVLRQGSRTRYSDDGEPAKTAGLPVLDAIRHAGLTDCIVVVTRYFGGHPAGHRRAGARLHRERLGRPGRRPGGHRAGLRAPFGRGGLGPL